MARRVPGARSLMEAAAVELYAEKGPGRVTAAEIAERAGVTERTFFRHFPQKSDVFFGDELRLREALAQLIVSAPRELTASEAMLAALHEYSAQMSDQAEHVRRRAAIVEHSPELRARELSQGAAWAAAMRDALRQRGTDEGLSLTLAYAGLSLFRAAYEAWLATSKEGDRIETYLDAEINSLREALATVVRQ